MRNTVGLLTCDPRQRSFLGLTIIDSALGASGFRGCSFWVRLKLEAQRPLPEVRYTPFFVIASASRSDPPT